MPAVAAFTFVTDKSKKSPKGILEEVQNEKNGLDISDFVGAICGIF